MPNWCIYSWIILIKLSYLAHRRIRSFRINGGTATLPTPNGTNNNNTNTTNPNPLPPTAPFGSPSSTMYPSTTTTTTNSQSHPTAPSPSAINPPPSTHPYPSHLIYSPSPITATQTLINNNKRDNNVENKPIAARNASLGSIETDFTSATELKVGRTPTHGNSAMKTL